jgi:hypothetical protein
MILQNNAETPIKRISGRGELYVAGEHVAEVQYTLTITDDVTFVPAAGESASEKHISGEIAVLERAGEPARSLREFVDDGLDLHLDDGSILEVMVTDRVPGGYLVEGQGEIQDPPSP